MRFNINVQKLNSFCESFDRNCRNFENNYNDLYSRMKKVDNAWKDENAKEFVSRLESDKNQITQYMAATRKYYNSISAFTQTISSISRLCDVADARTLVYDSTFASATLNCIYAGTSSIANSINFLNRTLLPADYRYQMNILKQNLRDLQSDLTGISDNVSNISNRLNNAFNDIKNSCSGDVKTNLAIMPLSIKTSTASVSLKDISYTEKKDFGGINSTTDYDLADLDFVNNANLLSTGAINLDYSQQDLNYKDTSDHFGNIDNTTDYKQQDLNYKDTSDHFGNIDNTTDYKQQDLNYKDTSTRFSTISNKTDYKQDSLNYQNTSNEYGTSQTTININKANLDSVNVQKNDASSVSLNANKQTVNNGTIDKNQGNNVSMNINKQGINNQTIDRNEANDVNINVG